MSGDGTSLECDHDYTYAGVVFSLSTYPIPGSGAREVSYYDRFFCKRCLDRRNVTLPTTHSSYEPIRYNATPMPQGDTSG